MSAGKHSTLDIRVRAVKAVLNGMAMVDVAAAYQTDRTTVYRWLIRYRDQGEEGLQRCSGSGRPRTLGELDLEAWRRIVLTPASRFGYETDLWTATRVRQVIQQEFAVELSGPTVWRRLREAGLTWQKPDREYLEKDESQRQEWLRVTLPRIRRTVRQYHAILYFEDECHVSLTAFLGRTWAPRGQTPSLAVTGKRGGVAALSAINQRGRLVFRLYDKRVASGEVIDFLAQILAQHQRRHIVLVMDQAPPHVSKKTLAYVQSQKRLHVFHLPSYSPDWNPDEKVWSHLKCHELKGHQARTKKDLLHLTEDKLTSMSDDHDLIHGLFFRCCIADILDRI